MVDGSTGAWAALATALCWTASGLAFEAAGKRIGSLAVNIIRLGQAAVFLSIFTCFSRGLWFPTDATADQWWWLGWSGLIGFTLGDLCLFRAYVVLGARLSMLVMSLVPPMTALTSWLWLGETLNTTDLLGMGITLGGVGWVIMERHSDPDGQPVKMNIKGLLLALGGAAGQAIGLVLSKHGMDGLDPFASCQIRVWVGLAGFAVLFTCIGWWGPTWRGFKHVPGLGFTSVGAFFGPFLGVSLSLLAVQYAKAGVAATLMALVPVLVLPAAMVIHKQKISWRAALGATIAVAGSAVLFLR